MATLDNSFTNIIKPPTDAMRLGSLWNRLPIKHQSKKYELLYRQRKKKFSFVPMRKFFQSSNLEKTPKPVFGIFAFW